MIRRSRYNILAAASGLLLSFGAVAHTPYLSPNLFEPLNNGLITLDASFAEHFFIPEVVFDGSDFEVRMPDGRVGKPDREYSLQTRTVLEHDLTEDGTYRFSTGRRLGRMNIIYERNGRQGLATTMEDVPDDAVVTEHYQSYTMAETYVTRGSPDRKALAARNDGLEFVAVSHPNDLFAGEALELKALFYGKPLEGLEIEAFHAVRGNKDDDPSLILTSDKGGMFTFSPEDGGVYLMRARHRAAAPDGSEAPEVSHTYTLVIEAVE